MDQKELLKSLSPAQRKELMAELAAEERQEKNEQRKAYEDLRKSFVAEVKTNVINLVDVVIAFAEWIGEEMDGFRAVMEEYGQIKREGQKSYTVIDDNLKIEARHNKVKRFDERADLASERLIDYIKGYIIDLEKGEDDPLYQLVMTLLERNRRGELDYKNISKLYSLEPQFDDEYRQIMEMFRESNVIEATRTNYYFHLRDKDGVWRRLEPSFNRY